MIKLEIGMTQSLKIYKITVDFRCGFCTHEEIRVETINHDDDSFINEKWEKIDMEIGVLPLSISTEIVRHSDVDSTEKALNSMDINFEIRFVSMSISRLNEYCSLISLGQSDGKVLILKFHFVKPDEQNYELSHENNAKDKHRLIIFSEFLDDSHNESAYCKGRSILSIDSFLVNWSSNINNKDKKTEGYEKKEMALLVAIGSTDGRVKILRLDFNQSDIHLGHNITINQNNVNCKINDDSRNQPNKMKLDKIFEYAPHQNGVCCLKLKPVVIQNPKKPSENYKNRYVSMEGKTFFSSFPFVLPSGKKSFLRITVHSIKFNPNFG
ncbi:hypothetical protein BY996DRAFT_1855195 [Phakopsora pachyrhizi]|nr:hypothetical protein BY996DRAFT_1855195 [Phakopsora pachyrhizi]